LNSSGGRTTYQNIEHARRRGLEARFELPLNAEWRLESAYTYLAASFESAFLTCPAASTCTTPNTLVPPGSRIPGVPKSEFFAALRYGGDLGWNGNLAVAAASNVAVNDQNTQFAPGYANVGASIGYGFELADAKVATFLRLDNALDRNYAGSVI